MTTLATEEDCQHKDSNRILPMSFESLRFPLDRSMRILFTGYYNGFSIEIRSLEEMALLYRMGCFGKGSLSRSKPRIEQTGESPCVMRRRQFLKRNYWYKKFANKENDKHDSFFKEVDKFINKVISDCERNTNKDVIDLVSSDEECDDDLEDNNDNLIDILHHDKQDIVVIVPNSDSEDENYFDNLKPTCCINKIKIQEKLILTLQEAFFLIYGLGCLQVINCDKALTTEQCWELFIETDDDFLPKYVVYHYYRSKGYIVKPGIKFGGDYLLYKEGPSIAHAEYIVVIKYGQSETNWNSITGHVRMATTTAKEILLAEVIQLREIEKLPDDLKAYSIREILLTRDIPVSINDETD